MTIEYLVFIFIIAMIAIALFSQFRRGKLFIFSASLFVLWIPFYIINGSVGYWAPWNINYTETYILVMAFFMLVFAILLSWMDIEIKHEARGQGGKRETYSTYGAPPKEDEETPAQKYRKYLHKRNG